MKDAIQDSSNSLNSYIETNRTKIDESLVSLRLMKEIDDFLDINNISQRDFADNVGYSEAYVSQLMSGTKKFNTSFINRFEKIYNLKIDFKIKTKNEIDFISKIANSTIEINVKIVGLIGVDRIFSFENKPNEFSQFNSSLLKLEI